MTKGAAGAGWRARGPPRCGNRRVRTGSEGQTPRARPGFFNPNSWMNNGMTFRIVVDTREKEEYAFPCAVLHRKLDAGDYSVQGHEDRVAVERKSLADFVHTLTGTMQEKVQLRPLSASELPTAARTWLDENTPKLIRQGFRQLGDYRLKQFSSCYARFFLSANGDSFAEISYVQLLFKRVKCVSYFSLTHDGYYLESSNLGFAGKRKAIANFEAQRMPGRSLAEIYQLHVDRLKQLQQGKPRTLRVEELERVIHYGNKRLYEILIDQQLATVNPYADFDDTSVLPQVSTHQLRSESSEPVVQMPAAALAAWDTTPGIDIPVA